MRAKKGLRKGHKVILLLGQYVQIEKNRNNLEGRKNRGEVVIRSSLSGAQSSFLGGIRKGVRVLLF